MKINALRLWARENNYIKYISLQEIDQFLLDQAKWEKDDFLSTMINGFSTCRFEKDPVSGKNGAGARPSTYSTSVFDPYKIAENVSARLTSRPSVRVIFQLFWSHTWTLDPWWTLR